MNSFVTKEVLNLRSVGEILRSKRVQLNRSIEEAAFATGIGIQYLNAMESDAFDSIAGSLYVKQFLKSYTKYLGIGEMASVLFERIQHIVSTPILLRRVHLKDLMVFPRVMRYGLAAGTLSVLFVVALVQLYTFVAPPRMDVLEPIAFTNHRLIEISGTADNAQTVVVNNEEVPINEQGFFSTTVPLVEGINALTVVATSRRGSVTEKPATIYYARRIPDQQLSAR